MVPPSASGRRPKGLLKLLVGQAGQRVGTVVAPFMITGLGMFTNESAGGYQGTV